MNELGAVAMIAVVVFGLVLLVLWVTRPFALFGLKGRLDVLHADNVAILDALKRIAGPGAGVDTGRRG